MNDSSLDDVLAQLAGRAGGLTPLLDALFGFLKRRTDFYVVHSEGMVNATMGFPPGRAREMVLKSMNKFPFSEYDIK